MAQLFDADDGSLMQKCAEITTTTEQIVLASSCIGDRGDANNISRLFAGSRAPCSSESSILGVL